MTWAHRANSAPILMMCGDLVRSVHLSPVAISLIVHFNFSPRLPLISFKAARVQAVALFSNFQISAFFQLSTGQRDLCVWLFAYCI